MRNIGHLIILALVSTAWGGRSDSLATKQLLTKLREAPRSYDPKIRPPAADWEATEVQVQTYIRDLTVDDVNMMVTYDLTLRMRWNDSRLSYNAAQDVDYVTLLEPDLLWIPDMFFSNGEVTQHTSVRPETLVRVYHDNRVLYSTRLTVKTKCAMSFESFPHDTQVCSITLASYGYTKEDLVLRFFANDPIRTFKGRYLQEYHVDSINKQSFSTRTSTGEYSTIQFDLRLSRAFLPYLLTWYLPAVLLVLVAWGAFLLPTDVFLPRLLLCLLPLLSLVVLAQNKQVGTPVLPCISGRAVFTGASVCAVLLTLLHVILYPSFNSDLGDGKAKTRKSDAGSGDGDVMVMMMVMMQGLVRDKAAFTRIITIITYLFFIIVYFLVYCA